MRFFDWRPYHPTTPVIDIVSLTLCHWRCVIDIVSLTLCHWRCVIDIVSLTLRHWHCVNDIVFRTKNVWNAETLPPNHACHWHCLIHKIKWPKPSWPKPSWTTIQNKMEETRLLEVFKTFKSIHSTHFTRHVTQTYVILCCCLFIVCLSQLLVKAPFINSTPTAMKIPTYPTWTWYAIIGVCTSVSFLVVNFTQEVKHKHISVCKS